MDRLERLRDYTDAELLEELNRRRAEYLDRARAISGGFDGQSGVYPRKSEAKARYWAQWKAYKAQHPDATIAEWRRSLKRKR